MCYVLSALQVVWVEACKRQMDRINLLHCGMRGLPSFTQASRFAPQGCALTSPYDLETP